MKYKTKQTDILLEALKEAGLKGLTASEAVDILKDKSGDVSRATIYRKLKVFENEGVVRVVNYKGVKRYEYVEDECKNHLHLICKNCKKIVHLNVEESKTFSKHVDNKHKFLIDMSKSTIYGLCDDCK